MFQKLKEDAAAFGLKHLLAHNIHDISQGDEIARELGVIYQCPVANMSIGPVIGAHVGPGAFGIVYCTER